MLDKCPCGSGKVYSDCCEPFHLFKAYPETAEQLMRSRFSAFVFQKADYLLQTWGSETRPDSIEFEQNLQWLSLTINGCKKGRKKDREGWVTFFAKYQLRANPLDVMAKPQEGVLHEKSYFQKNNQGHWQYIDGEIKE